jgi:hypothetical protein
LAGRAVFVSSSAAARKLRETVFEDLGPDGAGAGPAKRGEAF